LSRGILASGLSLGFQAYVLYYALHYGTLTGLLQWDDCAIVLRGFENLDRLSHSTSLAGLVRAALHLDIHAPLSDLQTIIGLLVSGGQTWGPFLLNAVWLALVLATILRTFARNERVLATVATVFVLVQTLTFNALADLKSDWDGGLLLAGALFLLARGAQAARQDLKWLGAALLGLAAASKLTAFYLPIVAVIALLLFEWYSAALETQRRPDPEPAGLGGIWRSINWRALLMRAAIATGPFVLFFLYSVRSLIGYIRTATGSVWQDGLAPLGRLYYYSPFGPDSWMEWGNLHLFFLVFAAAALFVAWRRRDPAYPLVLLVCAVIGVMLLAPLAISNSNHSFAATFLGVIIAATLLAIDYLVRCSRNRAGLAVGAVMLLVALPAGLPFKNSNYYSMFTVSNDELRELAVTNARIVDSVVTHARRDIPHIVICYDHVFAPYPNLAIEYFRRTGWLPAIDRLDDAADPQGPARIAKADFVLTLVPTPPARSLPDLYPAYPISRNPGQAEDLVHAAGQFEPVGSFAVRGGEIHLYSRHVL
jgi:hypothetical protein